MTAPLNTRLSAIRAQMKQAGLDGLIVLRSDEFNNEYVPARHERLAFATDFTGSAGAAIIMQDTAVIFTDSRYTIQVRMESPAHLFSYEDYKKESLNDWLKRNLKSGQKIGADANIVPIASRASLEKAASENSATLVLLDGISPLDAAWNALGRPNAPTAAVHRHDDMYAGESFASKKDKLAQALTRENCDMLVLNDLPAIAWLFNLRGADVPCTPIFLAHAALDAKGNAHLFIDLSKIDDTVEAYLNDNHVILHPQEDFFDFITTLANKTVWLDPNVMPVRVKNTLESGQNKIHLAPNPTTLMKAIKNKTEQDGAIRAHEIDAVALANFLHWMDTGLNVGHDTEMDVEAKLESFRALNPAYKGPSFETIPGAGAHGAIVHYRATEKTNAVVENNSLFLCDSGGQYYEGTTDVTRTLAIGTPTPEMKDRFTRVLKGHIAVALTPLDDNVTGVEVDKRARAALQEIGLNYGHGTGHGVGSYLSVHEGPHGIGGYWTRPYEVGMIVSNEPGFYKDGEYGIRIENLVMVQEDENGQRYFKNLTLAPIDKKCIAVELLTADEIAYVNAYHAEVYARVSTHLPDDVKAWLKHATAPL